MKAIPMTLVLMFTLAISACGLFSKKETTAPAGTEQPADPYGGAPETSGVPSGGAYPSPYEIGGGAAGGDSSGNAGDALTQSLVYFDYDSTALNAEGQRLAALYGKYLADHPAARLRLEGHTDERGTREYNVGLGERRAIAVQQAVLAEGGSSAQLSVISYGEERPVRTEQNESAWAQNRRVQIIKQ